MTRKAEAVRWRVKRTGQFYLSQTYFAKVSQLYVSASIGIVLYNDASIDLDTLVIQDDMVMYRAKANGLRNVFGSSKSVFCELLSVGARLSRACGLSASLHRGWLYSGLCSSNGSKDA